MTARSNPCANNNHHQENRMITHTVNTWPLAEDQPLITPSRCPHACGHEIAEHSEYGCADGCSCEWTPTSAGPTHHEEMTMTDRHTTNTTPATPLPPGGPICTTAAARAAGLDIPPAPAELAAMAETVVAAAGGAPTAEVDLARAVPLMLAALAAAQRERDEALARVAELEQQAAKQRAAALAEAEQHLRGLAVAHLDSGCDFCNGVDWAADKTAALNTADQPAT